ncbi:hypothetical protein JOC27_002327 [Sporolactobacillus spathodeae]|uniref:Uncharacterized protein n=1 Tax=Sporolactobacillus spathodeae TaxID=1465502 RepID=A0ABS2QAN4_9BACL|nr:hypothetical protein [Sporolactobacillus spathodeae]
MWLKTKEEIESLVDDILNQTELIPSKNDTEDVEEETD